ncbi:MAG: hypothetical protein J6Q07_02800 [Alistipes sp.]|nr:hypothetical protein [Alistipes sp.]
MKFLLQPENGSSWREPLVYSFDLEEATDEVQIEIRDIVKGVDIARLNLYGVSKAEVDIAPYLKEKSDVSPRSEAMGLYLSNTSFSVVVIVNGVASEVRTFHRERIDTSVKGVLTKQEPNSKIGEGETIRMTIYAQRSVTVVVRRQASQQYISPFSISAVGIPVEFIYPVFPDDDGLVSIDVDISCDTEPRKTYTYKYVPREAPTQQVVWYDKKGAVQSYVFPQVKRRVCEAIISGDMVIGKEYTWELTSAYESPEELERIRGVVFADRVYFNVGGRCVEVEMLTRTISEESRNLQIVVKTKDV